MTAPTQTQLAGLARLEEQHRRAVESGTSEVALHVARKPNPNARSLRVGPGLTGRLVQWGDGTWLAPSVVFVKTDALGRFLILCREQVAHAASGGDR